jgi:type III restriction enzyme
LCTEAVLRCPRQFNKEEQREAVFKDITTGEVTHTTILDTAGVAD